MTYDDEDDDDLEVSLPGHRAHAVVSTYATLLADRVGVDIPDEVLASTALLPDDATAYQLSIREWREVLAPVTRLIEQQAGREVEREVASDYRVAALMREGLLDPSSPVVAVEEARPPQKERFLDSEIVAVYW